MRNAVTDTALGYVKRWSNTDFATDGSFDAATETQVSLNDGTVPVVGITLFHNKVVSGAFASQSPAEEAATDAARAAEAQSEATGAVRIERVVANPGQLPVPPPQGGLLVGVVNTGGGVPGLALSTGTGWAIFASTTTIP